LKDWWVLIARNHGAIAPEKGFDNQFSQEFNLMAVVRFRHAQANDRFPRFFAVPHGSCCGYLSIGLAVRTPFCKNPQSVLLISNPASPDLAFMSHLTYAAVMNSARKPLVWLRGEIKTPPFSLEGRVEAGTLLRRLQEGESLGMPHSRPMPSIGPNCHELRVRDKGHNWRIIYRIDGDAIVIVEVFSKKTQQTPPSVITGCKQRLTRYDKDREGDNQEA
jgi:phage-related protein